MSETVTLINPFKVPAGKLAESIEYWEAHRDFLQKEPGYISTKLHQSLQEDATYQLINVAIWESQEAFFNAVKKMRAELGTGGVEGLQGNPSLYEVIRE